MIESPVRTFLSPYQENSRSAEQPDRGEQAGTGLGEIYHCLEEQAEKEEDKVYKGQKTMGDFSLSPRLQSMISKKVEALNKDSLFPTNPEGGAI